MSLEVPPIDLKTQYNRISRTEFEQQAFSYCENENQAALERLFNDNFGLLLNEDLTIFCNDLFEICVNTNNEEIFSYLLTVFSCDNYNYTLNRALERKALRIVSCLLLHANDYSFSPELLGNSLYLAIDHFDLEVITVLIKGYPYPLEVLLPFIDTAIITSNIVLLRLLLWNLKNRNIIFERTYLLAFLEECRSEITEEAYLEMKNLIISPVCQMV